MIIEMTMVESTIITATGAMTVAQEEVVNRVVIILLFNKIYYNETADKNICKICA